MNKKYTRKEFLLFIGSLVGIFFISRIPGTKKNTISHSYGSGAYGGTHTS